MVTLPSAYDNQVSGMSHAGMRLLLFKLVGWNILNVASLKFNILVEKTIIASHQ